MIPENETFLTVEQKCEVAVLLIDSCSIQCAQLIFTLQVKVCIWRLNKKLQRLIFQSSETFSWNKFKILSGIRYRNFQTSIIL